MKNQPNRNYKSDDVVMTPPNIADAVVKHFAASGSVMEPCMGTGNFIKAFIENGIHDILSCEIATGTDFLEYNGRHVDWIVTNPPWSQIREFLAKSFEVADNIVFLITVNHIWTKLRYRMMRGAGFGLVEICVFDAPKALNASGFVCGLVYMKRGYDGMTKISQLEGYELYKE
jgi:hypothetical protein